MRKLPVIVVLGASLVLLAGCLGAKKYEDYCNLCLDTFSDDGCKAETKSEVKDARVLDCTDEFKDLAECLDGAECTIDYPCLDTTLAYNVCKCQAAGANPESCTVF